MQGVGHGEVEFSSLDLTIELRKQYEFEVLCLKGDFSHLSVYQLRPRLQALLREKKKRFALDFTQVDQVDSAAVAILHQLVRDVESVPGSVIFLFGATREVLEQFETGGLPDKLLIVRSFEEGLRRLAANGS